MSNTENQTVDTQEDTSTTETNETNYLGLSDEEFLAMGEPDSFNSDNSTETSNDNPEDEANKREPEDEPSGESDKAVANEAESEGNDTEKPKADSPQEDSNASTTSGKEDSEGNKEIDYKAAYDSIFGKPIKANGKEFSITSPEEAIALMQQGANYSKKMASLKPNLRIIKMLEKNGLLDEQKLSFLIDIDKKNPSAIQKLLKESDVDLYGLDNTDTPEYTPNNYSPNEQEMVLDLIMDELNGTPNFGRMMNVITNEWDSSSQVTVSKFPELFKVIKSHMDSGIYDIISNEVSRRRMLGQFSGVSDIEAYRQVGDAIDAQGGFAHLFNHQQNTQAPVVTTVPPTNNSSTNQDLRNKKKALAPNRQVPKGTTKPEPNYLAMSDEEFLKYAATQG